MTLSYFLYTKFYTLLKFLNIRQNIPFSFLHPTSFVVFLELNYMHLLKFSSVQIYKIWVSSLWNFPLQCGCVIKKKFLVTLGSRHTTVVLTRVFPSRGFNAQYACVTLARFVRVLYAFRLA